MPCYRPISAWYTRDRHPTGGRVLSFGKHFYVDTDQGVDLPCGRCIGCKLERSRQWAVRLMHESQMHACSSFITLTYDDSNLPANGSLDLKHCQDFMKRLRFWKSSFDSTKLRFFLAGEYGEQTSRPHYHLILFGEDFLHDRSLKRKTDRGDSLYESETLSDLWGHGLCDIGDVTFESAAYVARYCTKKITGDLAESHYQGRKPEFATMSRRPGIGFSWFQKFASDVYPRDHVVVRGSRSVPPRAYDKFLSKLSEAEFRKVKVMRTNRHRFLSSQELDVRSHEGSTTRLIVKETVKQAQIVSLKRKL